LRERLGEKLEGKWGKDWDLSPLAMYWLGRAEEGPEWTKIDAGAIILEVVKAARKHGIPTEESWPYIESKFKTKPSERALKTGRWHQASPASYRCDEDGDRSKTVDRMLQALAAGLPVVKGFPCYANLSEADSDGILRPPRGAMEGGHCTPIYWADTQARIFWGPNSWGPWGGKGPDGKRGYIGTPFQWVLDGLVDDAHAIELEE